MVVEKVEVEKGVVGGGGSSGLGSGEIGEEEAQLYDRQIRLWGLAAQNRLRNAKVLLVGLGGLGAEVAKNLVLAGLHSITLSDAQTLSANDAEAQFLAPLTETGQNRAEASLERTQALNPMVEVKTRSGEVEEMDESFLAAFNLVVATDLPLRDLLRLSKLCRSLNVAFMAGDVRGGFAFTFADLGDSFTYAVEKKKKTGSGEGEADAEILEGEMGVEEGENEEPVGKKPRRESKTLPDHDDEEEEEDGTTFVKETESFASFSSALAVDWGMKRNVGKGRRLPVGYLVYRTLWALEEEKEEKVRLTSTSLEAEAFQAAWEKVQGASKTKTGMVASEALSHLSGSLAPLCAIAGGVLAQEAIKILSAKDAPLNNFFFTDALNAGGTVVKLPPA